MKRKCILCSWSFMSTVIKLGAGHSLLISIKMLFYWNYFIYSSYHVNGAKVGCCVVLIFVLDTRHRLISQRFAAMPTGTPQQRIVRGAENGHIIGPSEWIGPRAVTAQHNKGEQTGYDGWVGASKVKRSVQREGKKAYCRRRKFSCHNRSDDAGDWSCEQSNTTKTTSVIVL